MTPSLVRASRGRTSSSSHVGARCREPCQVWIHAPDAWRRANLLVGRTNTKRHHALSTLSQRVRAPGTQTRRHRAPDAQTRRHHAPGAQTPQRVARRRLCDIIFVFDVEIGLELLIRTSAVLYLQKKSPLEDE